MPSESGVAAETEDAASGTAESTSPTVESGIAVAAGPIEWGPVRHDRLRSLAAGFGIALVGALLALAARL